MPALLSKLIQWFRPAVGYPPQQLSDLQLDLINRVDLAMSEQPGPESDSQFGIHHIVIPVNQQFLPADLIWARIRSQLPKSGYIPRSVALVQSGLDWHLFIGVYGQNAVSAIEQILYVDALTRTNSARAEFQAQP
jgi:hypothetical protein